MLIHGLICRRCSRQVRAFLVILCCLSAMDNGPDLLEIAEAALLAAMIAAVRGIGLLVGLGQFILQEGCFNAAVQMLPGQDLIRTTPAQEGFKAQAALNSCCLPDAEVKVFRPAIESGPALPGRLQELGQSAVAP